MCDCTRCQSWLALIADCKPLYSRRTVVVDILDCTAAVEQQVVAIAEMDVKVGVEKLEAPLEGLATVALELVEAELSIDRHGNALV